MSFESDLYGKLSGTSGITSLLGTLASGAPCIFPVHRPQASDLPALRYTVVSDDVQTHLRGTSGITRTSVQIDCYAATVAETVAIAQAVKAGLLAGVNGRGAWGDTFVNSITMTAKVDEFPENDEGANDQRVFNRSLDFEIWHSELAIA